jgi:hypothetical protein
LSRDGWHEDAVMTRLSPQRQRGDGRPAAYS